MARLQRFYGARDPYAWLHLTPSLRDGLLDWIPRLQAEEDMRAGQIALLPMMGPDERQTLFERLRARARGGLDDEGHAVDPRGYRIFSDASSFGEFIAYHLSLS